VIPRVIDNQEDLPTPRASDNSLDESEKASAIELVGELEVEARALFNAYSSESFY
jgi:hypothetical protein